MSDKPCKKIDIFADGVYVCTTSQSRTIKEAIERFKANPKWMGLKRDGGIGICSLGKDSYWSISAWWSSNQ